MILKYSESYLINLPIKKTFLCKVPYVLSLVYAALLIAPFPRDYLHSIR